MDEVIGFLMLYNQHIQKVKFRDRSVRSEICVWFKWLNSDGSELKSFLGSGTCIWFEVFEKKRE